MYFRVGGIAFIMFTQPIGRMFYRKKYVAWNITIYDVALVVYW